MNAHSKTLFTSILAILFVGCVSTNHGKILRNSLIAGTAGVMIGSARNDHRATYAAVYGSSAATIGALLSSYYYNSDNEIQSLRQETKNLQEKLDRIQEPKLTNQGKSLFTSALPSDVSPLIQPGAWKRYKLDQWVQDPSNANIWFRQTEMFEVIPPSSQN